ncbi:MAG: hypothetical protein Q7L07_08705 [Pseudohongiella sp.]|nr:hypothetical protein [Pseudohongiella sp.]
MNNRPIGIGRLTLLGSSIATLTFMSFSMWAQDDYTVPRTWDGVPDLQGVWRNATVTPLERPAELGNKRAYTREEAFALERAAQQEVEEDNEPLDPNRPPPPATALPPVGNYDLFWTDRGMFMPTINGEYRTSIIIEPENGQIPGYKPEFLAARAAQRASGPGPFDGPEGRGAGERCLLSFGSHSGPPMLPVMYNSHYEIFQSPGYVVILAEMVHDARIIKIMDDHAPTADVMEKWMGDSIGRWDGDTLVVQTRHFNPDQNFRGASENLTVIEKFRRDNEHKIIYSFTVQDPSVFESSFTGELALTSFDEPIYEYACHEGNYALAGTLAGARLAEEEARKASEAQQ